MDGLAIPQELVFATVLIPLVVENFCKRPFPQLSQPRWSWVTDLVALVLSMATAIGFVQASWQIVLVSGAALWVAVTGAYQKMKQVGLVATGREDEVVTTLIPAPYDKGLAEALAASEPVSPKASSTANKGRVDGRALLVLVLLLVGAVLIAGCSGVTMNAQYSTLLDKQAAWADDYAERAERGELESEQMAAGLRVNAEAWEQFRAARDGREVMASD